MLLRKVLIQCSHPLIDPILRLDQHEGHVPPAELQGARQARDAPAHYEHVRLLLLGVWRGAQIGPRKKVAVASAVPSAIPSAQLAGSCATGGGGGGRQK